MDIVIYIANKSYLFLKKYNAVILGNLCSILATIRNLIAYADLNTLAFIAVQRYLCNTIVHLKNY